MERTAKHEQSQALKESLDGVTALVLVSFDGLTVQQAESLRGKFRDEGCSYRVYKNSVIRFAVTGTPHEAIVPLLKGSSGLAFNEEDPGAPARVAKAFAKEHDSLQIKGGVIDGRMLDTSGVETLASMPGPKELKAQFLALLNTPATQFVRVLNAPAQSLLYVLNAKKEKDAEAA